MQRAVSRSSTAAAASTVAGSSRQPSIPAACSRRLYATAASPRDRDSTAGDNRLEILRKTLYPPQSGSTSSSQYEDALSKSSRENPSTPTGSYRPDYVERLMHVLDPTNTGRAKEIHDTITRAQLLQQRLDREQRLEALKRKEESMRRACDALIALGDPYLINKAFTKPDPRKAPDIKVAQCEKLNAGERKWHAARIEGLFPREMAKVPRETWPSDKAARWDHDWKRVKGS